MQATPSLDARRRPPIPTVSSLRKSRIALFILLTIVVPPSLTLSQSTVSLKTDFVNYPLPALPTFNAQNKTVDPTFGTTILRVTSAAMGIGEANNAYSTIPTFNVNSTKLYIRSVATAAGYFIDFDPVNFTAGSTAVPVLNPPAGLQQYWMVWSGTNPDIIFCHAGLSLYSYTVSTQTFTLLRTFTATQLTIPGAAMLNQMSHSEDDDVFAWHVTNSSGSPVGYFAWRRSTNTFLNRTVSTGVNEVQVDKTGRFFYAVLAGNDDLVDFQTGVHTAFDATPEHRDMGRGTMLNIGQPQALHYRPNLATPATFLRLMQGYWSTFSKSCFHYSMNATNEGWGLISVCAESYGNGSGNDGTFNQAPFDNEIDQVQTDAAGGVRRIAHHRSVGYDYYSSPFANISKDGRYVVFDSNWGVMGGRRDVYVVQIPPAPGGGSSTPPATPTGLRIS